MTSPPHVDVDVPLALRQRMGSLLADFDEYMRRRGKLGTRVPKRDGGNHVTAWWLHVPLHAAAPTKSRVVYGETLFDAVNPVPHRWMEAKGPFRQEAVFLLREFIQERVREEAAAPASPPPALTAIADFDGREWGDEYLSFRRGGAILPLPRCGADAAGWAYSLHLHTAGWYPPAYAV